MNTARKIEKAYEEARERYAECGVDADEALKKLSDYPISLHCWQGDDVGGFERPDAALSGGGIQVTGNHPGKARNPEELRADLDRAYSLIPGRHRLNLHAIYGEFGGKRVDRDAIEPKHFEGWIRWARERGIALDFNASCFSHPKAEDGFTLSCADQGIRSFWIEHVRRCREISAAMGRAQGTPCLHNLWIPDGSKDLPADRHGPRRRLAETLDRIYAVSLDPSEMKDSLESKLFGIGSESYVVGSHEFYMGYALTRGKMICLDLGHYHPTESVGDKISAILPFSKELLLHVSRGVRWDSDHVVILDDGLLHLAAEIVRSPRPGDIHIALDFFDATLNRVGAWVIGTRAVLKALLIALLSPQEKLLGHEASGDFFARLALMEEAKTMPFGAVWDRHCAMNDVPQRAAWMEEIQRYEEQVTRRRGA